MDDRKVALITGGGGGVGLATARLLVRDGDASDRDFSYIPRVIEVKLRAAGVSDEMITKMLVTQPARVLARVTPC